MQPAREAELVEEVEGLPVGGRGPSREEAGGCVDGGNRWDIPMSGNPKEVYFQWKQWMKLLLSFLRVFD